MTADETSIKVSTAVRDRLAQLAAEQGTTIRSWSRTSPKAL
ncbi:hypothetical protein [Streptomyces sp. NPDC006333]